MVRKYDEVLNEDMKDRLSHAHAHPHPHTHTHSRTNIKKTISGLYETIDVYGTR